MIFGVYRHRRELKPAGCFNGAAYAAFFAAAFCFAHRFRCAAAIFARAALLRALRLRWAVLAPTPELDAGKRTQLPQRVLVKVHIAVCFGRSGAGRRYRKIGDQQVIIRESKVDGGQSSQTPYKKPGSHHQQQGQRNFRDHQPIAQQPCAFAAAGSLRWAFTE